MAKHLNIQVDTREGTTVKDTMTIAVTGKGGTGKTVLSTLLIGLLAQRFKGQVLAIDADSALSLPYTLGIMPDKTVTDLRKSLIGSKQLQQKFDNTPSKVLMQTLLAHGNGFDLLAMGRPEEKGCFCAINDLLRFGISMLSDDYLVTVIDGEAGPEQLNRRVVERIDILLVVADMSLRSLETAAGILQVAYEGIDIGEAGLVLNRVREDSPEEELLKRVGLDVFARLPEDDMVNSFDREGKSLLSLPDESPCKEAVKSLLKKIMPTF